MKGWRMNGRLEFQKRQLREKESSFVPVIHDFYCVVVARVFAGTDNRVKRAKVREPIYAP